MERIVVKKRKEIALWKVNSEEVCPNTVFEDRKSVV